MAADINGQNYLVGLIAQQRANALQNGTTSDAIAEGSTNLYFTSARARSTVSASSPFSPCSENESLHILVAEDSTINQLVISNYLQKMGQCMTG